MKHYRTRTTIKGRGALSATALLLALTMTITAPGQAGSGGAGTGTGSGSSGSGTGTGATGGAGGTGSRTGTGTAGDATATTRSGAGSTGAGSTASGSTASTETSADTRKFIQKAAKSGLKEVRFSQLAAERATNPAVRDYAQMIISDHTQANANLTAIARRRGVAIPDAHGSTGAGAMGSSATGTSPGSSHAVASTGTGAHTAASDAAAKPRSTVGGQAGAQAPAGGASSARGTDTRSARTNAGDSATTEALNDVDQEASKLAEKSGADFDRAYVERMVKDHKEAIDLFEDATKRTNDPEISSFAQATLPKLRGHLSQAEALARDVKR